LFFGDFLFWKIESATPYRSQSREGKIITVIAQSRNLLFLRIVVFA
jgi:hypothetical protein